MALFYFLYSLLTLSISIINGNPLKYIISDFLRSQAFFIVLSSLILYMHNKNEIFKMKFLDYLLIFTFANAIIGFMAKLILMSSGTFYGGGLNQYMPAIHVLVILLIYYTKLKLGWKKLFLFSFIFLLIVFTILSLKRGNWVSLIIVFFALNFFVKKRLSLNIFLLILLVIGMAFLIYFDLIDIIVNRFMYTDNSIGLDNSTASRLAEIAGVQYTFDLIDISLAYITGFGNGALYLLDPSLLVDTGRYREANVLIHHSHPMFNLLFIRNGLIGVFVYSSVFLIILAYMFKVVKKFKRSNLINNKYGILFLAFGLEMLNSFVLTLKSNALYGSIYSAIIVFAFIQSYKLFYKNSLEIKNEKNITSH